jgi:PBP1b-binding outer membrane lipoprotein LpoB
MIMKKALILLLAAAILFSGCVGQKTVKTGDKISVDYIGSLPDGKVFDTSIYSVARENNLFTDRKSVV